MIELLLCFAASADRARLLMTKVLNVLVNVTGVSLTTLSLDVNENDLTWMTNAAECRVRSGRPGTMVEIRLDI